MCSQYHSMETFAFKSAIVINGVAAIALNFSAHVFALLIALQILREPFRVRMIERRHKRTFSHRLGIRFH